jgi:DNA-binding CsgD family transcriptional regulator
MTAPVKLTKRMKQLLGMIESGMSNRDISKQLDISEHTVKVHMWRMYQRIGVASRTQALAWWRANRPAAGIDALVVAAGALLAAASTTGSITSELAALGVAYQNMKGVAA